MNYIEEVVVHLGSLILPKISPDCCTVQAILGDASDGKLGLNVKAKRELLKTMARDAPGQIALLIALEHFLGVTNPGQVNQVLCHLRPHLANCMQIAGNQSIPVP